MSPGERAEPRVSTAYFHREVHDLWHANRTEQDSPGGIWMEDETMKFHGPFVFVAAATGLLALAPPAWSGGDAAKGKAIYEQRCMACHGPQGRGDGPTGKVLVPPAADFTSAASKKKSDADLLKIIENGKPPTAMIAWKGQLSDQEIQNVLAYVKTLRK